MSATAASAGVKLEIEECETGYDTKRGVECYEAVKGRKPALVVPSSTGLTLQLVPKASVDKIPILSIGYGPTAAAAGGDFPWAFNPPATHFDALSMIFQYIGGREGGLERLKGKTIGYIFLDGNFGREPIPLLQQFAADYGFAVKMYPVAAPQAQNQSAQWRDVGRDRPDWMIMWGFGAMNAAAIKEAAAIHFPMDRFIGSWHAGGEDDVQPAGAGAKGYLALNFNGIGADYPAIQDIVTHVDRYRQQPGRPGKGRRESLQPRRLQRGPDRPGDPQRPAALRPQGRHRQGGAPRARSRSPSPKRAGASSACPTSPVPSPAFPAPTTTATRRPMSSNGTAPGGPRCRIGSCR